MTKETLDTEIVLIPSSSGQSFDPRKRAGRNVGRVLIPSSSGQSFDRGIPARTGIAWSLNPFFIRSIVRSDGLREFYARLVSLNPFFIRSIVRSRNDGRNDGRNDVLIPSSSGQSFDPLSKTTPCLCLVLIPYSSGQSFDQAQIFCPTAGLLS